jgi:hypothetical protein
MRDYVAGATNAASTTIGPATAEAKKPAPFAWEATRLKPAQPHSATSNAL